MAALRTVADLVGSIEKSSFDFKTEYDLKLLKTPYDLAKDVAAYATAIGGTILVGARHEPGKGIVRLQTVADPQTVVGAMAKALQQYCVPVPSTPAEETIVVTPAEAVTLLAEGCTPPTADVTLLAIRVEPDPRGPIGVRVQQPNGQPVEHAYRFPRRIGDQTDFIDPTELAMWMNSQERRIAILLRQALRSVVSPLSVRVHSIRQGAAWASIDSYVLVEVDEAAQHVVLRIGDDSVNVPLAYVDAVWRDPGDGQLEMAVRGSLFAGRFAGGDPYAHKTESPRFSPQLGKL